MATESKDGGKDLGDGVGAGAGCGTTSTASSALDTRDFIQLVLIAWVDHGAQLDKTTVRDRLADMCGCIKGCADVHDDIVIKGLMAVGAYFAAVSGSPPEDAACDLVCDMLASLRLYLSSAFVDVAWVFLANVSFRSVPSPGAQALKAQMVSQAMVLVAKYAGGACPPALLHGLCCLCWLRLRPAPDTVPKLTECFTTVQCHKLLRRDVVSLVDVVAWTGAMWSPDHFADWCEVTDTAYRGITDFTFDWAFQWFSSGFINKCRSAPQMEDMAIQAASAMKEFAGCLTAQTVFPLCTMQFIALVDTFLGV